MRPFDAARFAMLMLSSRWNTCRCTPVGHLVQGQRGSGRGQFGYAPPGEVPALAWGADAPQTGRPPSGVWEISERTYINAGTSITAQRSVKLGASCTVSNLTLIIDMGFHSTHDRTRPVILRHVTNAATVGWYAAASRLVGTSLFLSAAIMMALPMLSRLHREDASEFCQLVRRMLVPGWLVALQHYPAIFAHSIPVLRVGGLGVLLYYMAMVLGTAVIASDGQHKMMRISMIATAVSIPACLVGAFLTHVLWRNGAVGAIFSDILVEIYLVYSYFRMLPARTFIGENLVFLGRCTAAAIPMTVFLEWMSRRGSGLWIIIPCVIIYGVMCLLLRCVSVQDLAMAQQIFARRA